MNEKVRNRLYLKFDASIDNVIKDCMEYINNSQCFENERQFS